MGCFVTLRRVKKSIKSHTSRLLGGVFIQASRDVGLRVVRSIILERRQTEDRGGSTRSDI